MFKKPTYIYFTGFLGFIVAYLFFSVGAQQSTSSEVLKNSMPHDAVHGQASNGGPSSENVNENARNKSEQLRKDYFDNPNDTSAAKKYADWCVMSHDFERAIDIYQNILQKGSDRSDIMYALTYLYFDKGNFEKAEDYTNQILKLDRNDRHAFYNVGVIEDAKGNTQKAKKIFEEVLKKYPNTEVAKNSSIFLKKYSMTKQ